MLELIESIKAGDRSRLAELYEQNRGLLYPLARRYAGIDPATDMDDLMQAGYLGLAAAVDAWEPDGWAWSTVATGYVRNAMRKAVGIAGTRRRAHLGAVPLDAPLPGGEDGDTTRADLLADESLPDADERVLDDERRAAVREAVGRLEGRRRDVVDLCDLQGQTLARVGEGLDISAEAVRCIRTKALRDLRHDRQLRRMLEDETPYYQHRGVGAFNSSWESVTERVALWRIERERELFGAPVAAQGAPSVPGDMGQRRPYCGAPPRRRGAWAWSNLYDAIGKPWKEPTHEKNSRN